MKGQQRVSGYRIWTLVLGILIWVSFVGHAWAQKDLKIGVVDLQAVLDNSVRGKAAKDRLKDLGEKLQEEIQSKRKVKEEKEQELQKLRTDIRSKEFVLTEQARAEKAEVFRKEVRELKRFIEDTNRFIEDATQQFREKEIQETQRLLREVRDVVRDVGKKDKYSMILEGNEGAALVLYFGEKVDLTSKIIQIYDQASAAKR